MNKPSIWRPGGGRNRTNGPAGVAGGRRPASPSVWHAPRNSRATAAIEAPPKKARKKRYYTVRIDEAWCKACGICATYCPTGTLADAGHGEPRIVDMDLCNGCQLCVVRCPDFAVVVEQRGGDNGRGDA